MVDDERGGGTGGEGQTTGNPPLPGTIRRFIIKTGCLEASVVQIKPANIWIFYFRAARERKRERERVGILKKYYNTRIPFHFLLNN